MKDTLAPGAKVQFRYEVRADKTVPNLYPESTDFQLMPDVFATGFMVGLMEWACMKVLQPHLEDGEGSLGVHVDVSHSAATVPGQVVTVDAECIEVHGRRIGFRVKAHDGIDNIGEGCHERIVVPWNRFIAQVNAKAEKSGVPAIGRKAG